MAIWSVAPSVKTSHKDILSDSVPIKSTVLALLSMALLSVFAILVTFADPRDELGLVQAVIAVSMLRLSLHMVLTLVFTVKSQDKKTRPILPPPNDLQYYD